MRPLTALPLTLAASLSLAAVPATASAQTAQKPKAKALIAALPAHFFTAHRGAGSFLAPENTEAALAAGVANPDADLLEFDVQVLKDGVGGIWHDSTVDRISTATGNVTALTSTQFKALTIDAPSWFGGKTTSSHPMLFTELLDEFGGKKALLAHAKNTAAMHLVIDEVTKRGLTGSVLTQTTSRADAAMAHQAGLNSQLIISNATQAATDTPAAVVADGIPRVSVYSALPDSLISSYINAGLTVTCWDVDTQYRRDQLYKLGVQGIDSDDPTYVRGNTAHYHRTSAPFNTGSWTPGQMGQNQTPNNLSPAVRGTFTAPNWWTVPASSTGLYERQGWATPLAATYTLHTWIRYDTISTDKTRWAGLYFSSKYDARYNDTPTGTYNAGYTLILRQNGQLQLYRKDPTKTILLKTVQTPALTKGTIAKISLQVKTTTIYIHRYDITSKGATITDHTYRGPYLYLGRSATTGHPGPQTSFSNIAFF